MSEIENTPWLHVRGQFTYHGEALISGSRAGLEELRRAIERALDGREGEALVFANDGEGYALTVRCLSRLQDMGKPPYIDNLAREMATFELDWVRGQERRNRDVWLEKIYAATKT